MCQCHEHLTYTTQIKEMLLMQIYINLKELLVTFKIKSIT